MKESTMQDSSIWSVEQFKSDLGALILHFHSLFLSEVNSVINNPRGDRKNSMKALAAMNLVSINNNVLRTIDEIEKELRSNAFRCLTAYDIPEEQANSFIAQRFYPGSLKALMIDDINSTIQQLDELKSGAIIHLQVLENSSGFKGMFRGLVKGYTNPIDGLSHACGQGSMQTELATSVSHFNALAMRTGCSIDAVSQRLQVVVLDKWNKDLSRFL